MPRPSLSWPVSILAGFGVFLVLLFVGALDQGAAAQDPNCTPYPGCYRTAVAARKAETTQAKANAAATDTARTALAAQGTCVRKPQGGPEESYPCPTATASATQEGGDNNGDNNGNNNGNNNGGGNQQPTATNTFTPTATRAVTATATSGSGDDSAQQATPTATRSVSPTDDAGAGEAGAPTPTPLLPPGVTTIACVPGETVELSGETTPNTALLLFFGERPVGGGVSGPAGSYRLRLQVGAERPGLYLVEVRERTGRALVDQFGCEVPSLSPTPTPLQ